MLANWASFHSLYFQRNPPWAKGLWSGGLGPRGSGDPGQLPEGKNGKRGKDNRLDNMDPEPGIGPAFRDQAPRPVKRTHQCEKGQVGQDVDWNAGQDRVVEVSDDAEADPGEKVNQKFRPQQTVVDVRQRKESRGNGNRD